MPVLVVGFDRLFVRHGSPNQPINLLHGFGSAPGPHPYQLTINKHGELTSTGTIFYDPVVLERRGILHGIPIGLKDNIETAGLRTTAASGALFRNVPFRDAEVVRLLKSAGAIVIGKHNLHEFAHGGTSAISRFGAVHNPWNLDYSPGGSSGGSAAAVATGMCYGAVGTDTGGSVRIAAHLITSVDMATFHSICPNNISMHGRENALDLAAVEEGVDSPDEFHVIRHSAPPFISTSRRTAELQEYYSLRWFEGRQGSRFSCTAGTF
jgi:hypothetical protein